MAASNIFDSLKERIPCRSIARRILRPEDDAAAAIHAQLIDLNDGPEIALLKARSREQIASALEKLPLELRECIVLREFEELSYKEIAQVTDNPFGTIMSRLVARTSAVIGNISCGGLLMRTSAPDCIEMELLLQADIDGELDAAASAAMTKTFNAMRALAPLCQKIYCSCTRYYAGSCRTKKRARISRPRCAKIKPIRRVR